MGLDCFRNKWPVRAQSESCFCDIHQHPLLLRQQGQDNRLSVSESNPSEMSTKEVLKVQLDVLRQEHRALDDELQSLSEGALGDNLHLQRLKRRKLKLKDRIARLEDQLTPDIIA